MTSKPQCSNSLMLMAFKLVGNEDVQTTLAVTMAKACQHLQVASFDCIILDIDIEQASGIKLLEQMKKEKGQCQTPLIIYAKRELSRYA
ncbi:MAG TPA: response regulator [Thiotrichaceae bacterium]|nr:response regulator [Thiotrichaceae bacterium]